MPLHTCAEQKTVILTVIKRRNARTHAAATILHRISRDPQALDGGGGGPPLGSFNYLCSLNQGLAFLDISFSSAIIRSLVENPRSVLALNLFNTSFHNKQTLYPKTAGLYYRGSVVI